MGDRPGSSSRVRTSENKVRKKYWCWSVRAVYILEKLPDVKGPGFEEAGRYTHHRRSYRRPHDGHSRHAAPDGGVVPALDGRRLTPKTLHDATAAAIFRAPAAPIWHARVWGSSGDPGVETDHLRDAVHTATVTIITGTCCLRRRVLLPAADGAADPVHPVPALAIACTIILLHHERAGHVICYGGA